jgi:hypothetical protein
MTKHTTRRHVPVSLTQLASATGGGGAIGGSTGGNHVLGTGGGTSTPPALELDGGMSGGTGIGGVH